MHGEVSVAETGRLCMGRLAWQRREGCAGEVSVAETGSLAEWGGKPGGNGEASVAVTGRQ